MSEIELLRELESLKSENRLLKEKLKSLESSQKDEREFLKLNLKTQESSYTKLIEAKANSHKSLLRSYMFVTILSFISIALMTAFIVKFKLEPEIFKSIKSDVESEVVDELKLDLESSISKSVDDKFSSESKKEAMREISKELDSFLSEKLEILNSRFNILLDDKLSNLTDNDRYMVQLLASTSKFIEESKRTPQEWLAIAFDYRINREYKKAIENYNQALKVNPDYILAYQHLANLYRVYLKDFEMAKFNYQKILELNENSSEANYYLSVVLLKLNQIDKAKSHYRKAMELNPNLKEISELE